MSQSSGRALYPAGPRCDALAIPAQDFQRSGNGDGILFVAPNFLAGAHISCVCTITPQLAMMPCRPMRGPGWGHSLWLRLRGTRKEQQEKNKSELTRGANTPVGLGTPRTVPASAGLSLFLSLSVPLSLWATQHIRGTLPIKAARPLAGHCWAPVPACVCLNRAAAVESDGLPSRLTEPLRDRVTSFPSSPSSSHPLRVEHPQSPRENPLFSRPPRQRPTAATF